MGSMTITLIVKDEKNKRVKIYGRDDDPSMREKYFYVTAPLAMEKHMEIGRVILYNRTAVKIGKLQAMLHKNDTIQSVLSSIYND